MDTATSLRQENNAAKSLISFDAPTLGTPRPGPLPNRRGRRHSAPFLFMVLGVIGLVIVIALFLVAVL